MSVNPTIQGRGALGAAAPIAVTNTRLRVGFETRLG